VIPCARDDDDRAGRLRAGCTRRTDGAPGGPAREPPATRTLRASAVASIALFYFYGGLEAATGLWAATLLISSRGLSQAAAGALVAGYWAALTVGRFALGAMTERLGAARVVSTSVWTALAACLLLSLPETPAWFVALALALLGIGLAPIYPLVMHDTPTRFGAEVAGKLVGYQVAAATVGVATLPWLVGAVAEHGSPLLIPVCLSAIVLLLTCAEWARR